MSSVFLRICHRVQKDKDTEAILLYPKNTSHMSSSRIAIDSIRTRTLKKFCLAQKIPVIRHPQALYIQMQILPCKYEFFKLLFHSQFVLDIHQCIDLEIFRPQIVRWIFWPSKGVPPMRIPVLLIPLWFLWVFHKDES